MSREDMPDSSEVKKYIRYWETRSPEDILKCLEELRNFIYNNMTPEGREYFHKIRERKTEGEPD